MGMGYFSDCRKSLLMIKSSQKITRADKYTCPAASESGPGRIFCAEQRRNAQKVQKYRGTHTQSIICHYVIRYHCVFWDCHSGLLSNSSFSAYVNIRRRARGIVSEFNANRHSYNNPYFFSLLYSVCLATCSSLAVRVML